MATLYFVVTSVLGLTLTTGALLYFRKQGELTDNHYALIFTIGLSLTWFASFVAPFIAPESRGLNRELIIFALANSVCFGVLGYIIVMAFLAIRRKKK